MPSLREVLPNASASVIARNLQLFGKPAARAGLVDTPPRAELKPVARDASDEPAQIEAFYTTRVRVCVESRRCGVQCDPDNIVPKWHIDALRYARILRDDTNAEILLEVTETRVPSRKEEGCLVTITPISPNARTETRNNE